MGDEVQISVAHHPVQNIEGYGPRSEAVRHWVSRSGFSREILKNIYFWTKEAGKREAKGKKRVSATKVHIAKTASRTQGAR